MKSWLKDLSLFLGIITFFALGFFIASAHAEQKGSGYVSPGNRLGASADPLELDDVEKFQTAEEIAAQKKLAISQLSKESKGQPIRSFEVREFNFGGDHLQEVLNRLSLSENIVVSEIDGFPNSKRVVITGGSLLFYRNILAMAFFDDIQDVTELRAVRAQLEKKFGAKFSDTKEKPEIDSEANTITTYAVLRMNIAAGYIEIKHSATRTLDRRKCIDKIAKEIRSNIRLGIRRGESLTDRVESECDGTTSSWNIAVVNKAIESLANAASKAALVNRLKKEIDERSSAAAEKAKKF